jgi:hypothetical protein
MRASPILEYVVPESVKLIQQIKVNSGGGSGTGCSSASSMHKDEPCKCGSGVNALQPG